MTLGGDWSEIDEDDDDVLNLVPFHCEKCGNDVTGDGSREKLCRLENCVIFACRNCGYEWASWGPVGCPCQSRDPKIRRIREMYHRRKK